MPGHRRPPQWPLQPELTSAPWLWPGVRFCSVAWAGVGNRIYDPAAGRIVSVVDFGTPGPSDWRGVELIGSGLYLNQGAAFGSDYSQLELDKPLNLNTFSTSLSTLAVFYLHGTWGTGLTLSLWLSDSATSSFAARTPDRFSLTIDGDDVFRETSGLNINDSGLNIVSASMQANGRGIGWVNGQEIVNNTHTVTFPSSSTPVQRLYDQNNFARIPPTTHFNQFVTDRFWDSDVHALLHRNPFLMYERRTIQIAGFRPSGLFADGLIEETLSFSEALTGLPEAIASSASEVLFLSEAFTAGVVALPASITESVFLSEVLDAQAPPPPAVIGLLEDTLSLSESVDSLVDTVTASATDGLELTEVVTGVTAAVAGSVSETLQIGQAHSAAVFLPAVSATDGIIITELVDATASPPGSIEGPILDGLTLAEAHSAAVDAVVASVSDGLTFDEALDAVAMPPDVLFVGITDGLSFTEAVTSDLPVVFASLQDGFRIGEAGDALALDEAPARAPDERTVRVPWENRITVVPPENRTIVVPYEDRRMLVQKKG